jgi:c-di-GMP-binding flagellar brake protein YcgR
MSSRSSQGNAYAATQPASLHTLSGRAIDEFRVAHPTEVLALLRRLVDSAVLVQLSAPGGAAYTSTLWTVDAQARRISFDADPTHPQIRALIDAGEATAVAYLDAVKLQFDLHGLVLAHGHSASALQAALPDELFRFQRRASFRVRTRDCAVVHLRHPASHGEIVTLRVLDVSVGGCAVQLPRDMAPIEPGTTIAAVRIELDADTLFVAALTVQHVSGGFGNTHGSRLGCAFAGLDGTSQRALQRYIDLTQRREKFLLLG